MKNTTNINRGGRPKLKENEKSSNRIFTRFTRAEHRFIIDLAEAAEKKPAPFLHDLVMQMINNEQITIIKHDNANRKLMNQMRSISSNINQAMHAFNTYRTSDDLKALAEHCKQAQELIAQADRHFSHPRINKPEFNAEAYNNMISVEDAIQ